MRKDKKCERVNSGRFWGRENGADWMRLEKGSLLFMR